MAQAVDEGALARGRTSLRKHGSTFHAAHLLLGRKAGEEVRVLYGFCRHVDDLVDEQQPDAARRSLARVRRDLASGESDSPEVGGFLLLAKRRRIEPAVVEEFLGGFEQDLAPGSAECGAAECGAPVKGTPAGSALIHGAWEPWENQAELLRYCYRVAGTVGLMMCSLFDVDDPQARAHAVDLGIGMQLTNICRDVLEDADRGRIYLPAELTRGELSCHSIAAYEPDSIARARAAVERLLDLAEGYYRSADRGMAFLPIRARLAVLAASRRYEAIGPRIRRHRGDHLPRRAYVGGLARPWHMARGVGAAFASRLLRSPRRNSGHRNELHLALAGLPGASPELR